MNKVILVGNISNDIRTFELEKRTFCVFNLATSESIKTNSGWEKKTSFHSVKVYGQKAAFLSKYAEKGDTITIDGKLNYYQNNKDGVTFYNTEVVATSVDIVRKKKLG